MRKRTIYVPMRNDSKGRQLLATWLAEQKISAYRFDKLCEFRVGYASKLLRGELEPGRKKAHTIEERTEGAVPARSWDEEIADLDAGADARQRVQAEICRAAADEVRERREAEPRG